MSPDKQVNTASELIHERARNLAAEAIDTALNPGDTAWLANHLGSCPDCQAVADEYQAIHLELGSLELPEPPRDLWARTAAAFDAIDASAGRGAPHIVPAARSGRRPLFGTAFAVGVVAFAAAASLMIQPPLAGSSPVAGTNNPIAVVTTSSAAGPDQSPMALAVVKGTSYWISSDDGVYEIKGATAQCSAGDGSCTVSDGTAQTLGSISSDSSVSAVIAPDAASAAVWSADKVAIVPLSTQPQTVPLAQLTSRPTSSASARATATATATVTATATATATAATSAVSAASPTNGAVATASAAIATATATLLATATPTPQITAPSATASPPGSQATAILSGYEIVGRDPEFSTDGSLVAFSARPVDHSTGPDVFIWRAGTEQARPITRDHAGLFAGWFGQQILISEIAPASGGSTAGTTSFVYYPATGAIKQINRPMLMPNVDPTGKYVIYWSGTVEFDPSTGLWQPGKGDLYFDAWANLSLGPVTGSASPAPATPTVTVSPAPQPTEASPATDAPTNTPDITAETSALPSVEATAIVTAQPTAAPLLPQILPVISTPASVHGWLVRWDAAGQNVAIWVAGQGSARVGRLGLFTVDRKAGLVNVNEPRLAADKVLAGIQFDSGRLVYTSAFDGKTYMEAVPSVPPSNADTPEPTVPGQLPASGDVASAPAPQLTDRPGN